MQKGVLSDAAPAQARNKCKKKERRAEKSVKERGEKRVREEGRSVGAEGTALPCGNLCQETKSPCPAPAIVDASARNRDWNLLDPATVSSRNPCQRQELHRGRCV